MAINLDIIPQLSNDPSVAFAIFGMEVKWYGVFIALGIIFSVIAIICKLKFVYQLNTDPIYYGVIFVIIGGLIGARFGSMIIHQTSIIEFLNFRAGGMSIEYAVFFGLITAVIFFHIILKNPRYSIRDTFCTPNVVRRPSALLYFDAIAPSVLIGQIIGRWGNYFNQELYGRTVTDQWLINFLRSVLPYMEIGGTWHQPLFLYEGLLNLLGFVIIYWLLELIRNPRIRKTGDLFYCYFVWYGIVRIILEPLRDNVSYNQAVNMVTTICWIVLGLVLLVLNHCWFSRVRNYYFWQLHGYLSIYFIPLQCLIAIIWPLHVCYKQFYAKLLNRRLIVIQEMDQYRIDGIHDVPYYRGL